jgi:hypothetical protein
MGPGMFNKNGVIFYRGRSLLDGSPIVAVATGLASKSANGKTGNMVQTWILPDTATPPHVAVKTGTDKGVCGACPFASGRGCYVQVAQAPYAVWKAARGGRYATQTPRAAARMVAGRKVRLGAYGDPAALPAAAWRDLLRHATGHTGYSHQFGDLSASRRRAFAGLVMESAETVGQAQRARAAGRRTFRVGDLATRQAFETVCPASEEYFKAHGKRTTCERCNLCDGSRGARDNRPSVLINAHGAAAIKVRAIVAALSAAEMGAS